MIIDILSPILAGVITVIISALFILFSQKLFDRLLGRRKQPEKPYTERLVELTNSLAKASREVDDVLAELDQVARNRQSAVEKLEANLFSLESKEKGLKEKIEALEKTPLPVAEHFAKLLEVGERRNARRDYALFGAGVIVTTAIAIIIQFFTV